MSKFHGGQQQLSESASVAVESTTDDILLKALERSGLPLLASVSEGRGGKKSNESICTTLLVDRANPATPM
jgi:hypothetical protein